MIAFLRALERTGEARAAAADAGVDHTTAYARRRAHAEFAEAWEAALKAHKERVKREEGEAIAALERDPSTIHSAANGSPPRGTLGEELLASTSLGGQVRRVGHGRWSARKEAIFFEELAATANVQRSATAAGVSQQAVLARRLRHPLFRAKWEAVEQTARASIALHLIEESRKAFDPATDGIPTAQPRVTIDQAIKISQIGASKAQREGARDPFEEQAAAMSADEVAEIRERLCKKLQRLRERERPRMIAEGWSYDEAYDHMIPPGWVKAG